MKQSKRALFKLCSKHLHMNSYMMAQSWAALFGCQCLYLPLAGGVPSNS